MLSSRKPVFKPPGTVKKAATTKPTTKPTLPKWSSLGMTMVQRAEQAAAKKKRAAEEAATRVKDLALAKTAANTKCPCGFRWLPVYRGYWKCSEGHHELGCGAVRGSCILSSRG
ncbi:unnamed protein product [Polarella glacialis]|uniref:Uncharacterized protein n=1 Tax=Polarella glacialis TaxID=89957 RepID=A0A813K083_POLGL|nr:unnamed protein product [Polarella glacialis]